MNKLFIYWECTKIVCKIVSTHKYVIYLFGVYKKIVKKSITTNFPYLTALYHDLLQIWSEIFADEFYQAYFSRQQNRDKCAYACAMLIVSFLFK